MAITVKYLEGLGIEKSIAEQIFAERGKEVEADKGKREKLENDLKESNSRFDELNAEFEKLKADNADGAEWKSRFEELQAENEAKEKQAEADRILAEKNTRNREYFNSALKEIGKTSDDWNGKFTEDGYYNEFVKAIENEENVGKSHKDILRDMVKNDQMAFKGVTVAKLAGGTPTTHSKYTSREDILSIKDGATRRSEMLNNPQYFPEINS